MKAQMTMNRLLGVLLLFTFWGLQPCAHAQSDRPCGNSHPGGPSTPPCEDCPELCPSGTTAMGGIARFEPYSGNVHEEIRDLPVWGSVGEEPLAWRRYFNSRYSYGSRRFGDGGNWRYAYQWEVAAFGGTGRSVRYPDGRVISFSQTNINNQVQWVSRPSVTDRLYAEPTGFVLRRANGWRYHFTEYALFCRYS